METQEIREKVLERRKEIGPRRNKPKRIFEINCQTFKIIDEYRSLYQLALYMKRMYIKERRRLPSIKTALSYTSRFAGQYCGKCFVYADIYDIKKEEFDENCKIHINTNHPRYFIKTRDVYNEYKRILRTKRLTGVNKKEFKDIIYSYYKTIMNDLIENGGYYKGHGSFGRFEPLRIKTVDNEIPKIWWNKYDTAIKHRRVFTFRLNRSMKKTMSDNFDRLKYSYRQIKTY